MLFQWITCAAILCLLPSPAPARTVVLDPGHEPSQWGAVASCLKKEYQYNDEIAKAVAGALTSYRVVWTRQPGQEVNTAAADLVSFLAAESRAHWAERKTLLARAALANREKADLFISIHHDSVPDKDLFTDPAICDGKGGLRVKDEFRRLHRIGFNVFIYDKADKPRRARSLKLARALGRRLKALGRPASNYHVPPIEPCQSCHPVDGKLGVYNQDLAVLKNTTMPAVLIEVGNILDPEDERAISTPEFRQAFAGAVADAVMDYFKSR